MIKSFELILKIIKNDARGRAVLAHKTSGGKYRLCVVGGLLKEAGVPPEEMLDLTSASSILWDGQRGEEILANRYGLSPQDVIDLMVTNDAYNGLRERRAMLASLIKAWAEGKDAETEDQRGGSEAAAGHP